MRFLSSFCFFALALSPVANAAPTLYSQGDPSDGEQYLLLQLNRARMNPAAEGKRLAAWLTGTTVGKEVVAQYGTNPSQVASDFAALPVVPPLAFNADLIAASRAHSNDLATHGGNGPGGDDHAGYDGSTPDSRVFASGFRAVGNTDGYAGENYDPGSITLDEDHAGYLIDWGVADLGHRKVSMDGASGNNYIGIGVATITGETMLDETEDFGYPGVVEDKNYNLVLAQAPAILTGVVYTDKNGNGQYDPGEGVAGVTVSMDEGAYYAVTTSSGGFSVPLVNADGSNADGAVVVRTSSLSGEPAGRTAVVTITDYVTVDGPYRANVEWEVVPGQPTAGVAAGPALDPFFNGASALGNDWYYLAFDDADFFGYFNVLHYPYVYHIDLGWEYVQDAADGKSGVYLYDFASQSWFYTSPTFAFPYLYDFRLNAMVYYYPDTNAPGRYDSDPRYFYNFKTGKIITL